MDDQWDQYKVGAGAAPSLAPQPPGQANPSIKLSPDKWDQYMVDQTPPPQGMLPRMGRAALDTIASPYAEIGQGIGKLPNDKMGAAADIVGGTLGAASQIGGAVSGAGLIGSAAKYGISNTLKAIPWKAVTGGLAGGTVGAMAGGVAANELGASPDAQRLSSDLGGVAGGALGTAFGGSRTQQQLPPGTSSQGFLKDTAENIKWRKDLNQKDQSYGKALNLMEQATRAGRNNPGADETRRIAMAEAKQFETPGHEIGNVPGQEIDKLDHARGFVDRAQDALMQQLDQLYRDPAIARGQTVSGDDIFQRAMGKISSDLKQWKPDAAARVEQRLHDLYMGKTFNIQDTMERSKTLNKASASLFNLAPSNFDNAMGAATESAGLNAERSAIKEARDEALGHGDPAPGELMKRWGALEELGNDLLAQRNAALGANRGDWRRAMSFLTRAAVQAGLGEHRGPAANVASGVVALDPVANSGTLVQKAFKAFNERRQPITFNPPGLGAAPGGPGPGPKANSYSYGPLGQPPGDMPPGLTSPTLTSGAKALPPAPGGTWSMTTPPLLPPGSGPSNGPKSLPPPPTPQGPTFNSPGNNKPFKIVHKASGDPTGHSFDTLADAQKAILDTNTYGSHTVSVPLQDAAQMERDYGRDSLLGLHVEGLGHISSVKPGEGSSFESNAPKQLGPSGPYQPGDVRKISGVTYVRDAHGNWHPQPFVN